METDLAKIDPAWAWSPYEPHAEQPWDRVRVAHLYRRAGFAANWQQLDEAVQQTPTAVVKQLLGAGAHDDAFQLEMQQLGKTILATGSPQSLSAWWLYRMLHTPDQCAEKATLFWHGHFATSAAKVDSAQLMLAQNDLLRRHALGSFVELVQAISRDPAMLIYLDSATNRKLRPNENYARELMELFCLGPGNYTERDIKEVARCFTGWEVRDEKFRFNPYQHDRGQKSLLGQTGAFDGDDAVRIVLEQPAAPRFIVRKLIRYFVFDEPEPPASLVEPLATQFRENEFAIGPLIERVLSSQLFFSSHAIGRKIRSPVELGIGLLRALQGTTNVYRLSEELAQLGQSPFYPPNVKGWDGGRSWINSSTLLGRANLVRWIVRDQQSRFAGGGLAEYVEGQGGTTPAALVDHLLELLVAVPIPAAAREPLLVLARAKNTEANDRIATIIQAIATLPEFQLC
jgi:uncharacterized protein (DUF1800 family)